MFNPRRFLTLAAAALALTVPAASHAKPTRHARVAAASDYAYVFNSGSRGLPGYRIYVDTNGHLSSATLLRSGRTTGGRKGTLSPAVRRRFFADLAAAGRVDALPIMHSPAVHAANAAPGVRVTIHYHGRQSSDLRQAGNGAGETLYQDIKQIAQVLRLPIPDTP